MKKDVPKSKKRSARSYFSKKKSLTINNLDTESFPLSKTDDWNKIGPDIQKMTKNYAIKRSNFISHRKQFLTFCKVGNNPLTIENVKRSHLKEDRKQRIVKSRSKKYRIFTQ